MSVQFVRETIETGSILRATPQQTAVEGEILLPGGLRDEVKVLYTDAAVLSTAAENTGSRVSVSGRVIFRALYAQGDLTRIKAAEASADFSRALTVNQTDAAAAFQPQCEVTGVSARVFNGRLLLRAEMNVYAEAEVVREENVVVSVQEADTEVLEKEITTGKTVGGGSEHGLIRGEFEVSEVLAAQEALLAEAEARVEDIIGGADGRATVTGTIDLTACFSSALAGRPLAYTRYSLPFEQSVTLSGETGDLLSATAVAEDVAVALEENDKGKMLRAEVGLNVQLLSLREQKKKLVTDVFSTNASPLRAEGVAASLRTEIINEQAAESGRIQLVLPESAPRIKTVLAAFVKPVLAGAREQGGKLHTDMMLRTTLVYMTEDSGIPVSYTTEEPLRLSYSCRASADDTLSLSVSHVESAMVASDRAEVRCVVTLHATGARYEEVFSVTEIVPEETPISARCLALYITQPEERLWDVMKRYRLSEKAIKALNSEASAFAVDAELPPSTRLIAYKR